MLFMMQRLPFAPWYRALHKEKVAFLVNADNFEILYCYAYISHMSRKVLMFEHLARIGARAHGANPAVIARAVRHAAPGLVMALDYALKALALALSDYVYAVALFKFIGCYNLSYLVAGAVVQL